MTQTIITAENAFEPENRRRYLGGTDISALLGFNPYKTSFECWLEKTGREVKQQEESDILIFGHLLEPVIANEWLRRNPEWEIVSENEFVLDSEFEFLAANIDRVIKHKTTGELVILECKTVASSAFKHWKLGVPLQYYTQVQDYLGVKGYDRAIFAMLVMDSRELKDFVVDRDDVFIEEIRDKAVDYWLNNVEADVAPDKTAYDWSQGRNTDDEIVATAEDLTIFEKIKKLQKEEKDKKAEIDVLKEQIQLRMEDKGAMKSEDGAILFTWRGSDVERVDSKKLKADFPEVWQQVKKTAFERKFLIK